MKRILLSLLLAGPVASMLFSCKSPEQEMENVQLESYRKQGDSIVKHTFDTLRKVLTATMQEKGADAAVRYCNVQAVPLTALLAGENISVERVAEKTRNPANALDSLDRIQWGKYIKSISNKDSLQPIVFSKENTVHYYKPILLQAMCTTCHGDLSNKSSLVTVIDSLYPSDKARGFKEGDLRGMWHIIFKGE